MTDIDLTSGTALTTGELLEKSTYQNPLLKDERVILDIVDTALVPNNVDGHIDKINDLILEKKDDKLRILITLLIVSAWTTRHVAKFLDVDCVLSDYGYRIWTGKSFIYDHATAKIIGNLLLMTVYENYFQEMIEDYGSNNLFGFNTEGFGKNDKNSIISMFSVISPSYSKVKKINLEYLSKIKPVTKIIDAKYFDLDPGHVSIVNKCVRFIFIYEHAAFRIDDVLKVDKEETIHEQFDYGRHEADED